MKVTVQVVVDREDGTAPVTHDVGVVERCELTPASVGLQVAEAHQVLAGVQQHLRTAQADTALAARADCRGCGRAHRHKDSHTVVLRTLFGTLHLPSPAGGAAPAPPARRARSARWPCCCPNAPRPNCCAGRVPTPRTPPPRPPPNC